jgi:dynein-related subfamily AAA family protein
MLDRLARLYTAYMAQDVRSPIPHIAGPPGVGKSQAVEQLAKLVGKSLHVVNVSRMSPLEIEGIQMPINDRLHMLHSTLWTQLKEGDVVLLDEFLRGFPEVYNGLLDILTSRHVAGFDLPKVFFVAASNSVVTYDDALEDRLLHLYVPDLRNSTVEAEKLGKKLTESLGLLPALATSLEMQDMIQKEIAPMYDVLDQFKGTAQRGAPVKGSSARKLIGQAKLREFQSRTLIDLIDLNNQMASQQAKYQYLLLRPSSKLLQDASLATKLQSLVGNTKLTDVQQSNLQLNLELINEAAIYAEDRAAHTNP